MKQYLKIDPWKVIEDSFHPQHHRITEAVMSLGNGKFGQRANFEEDYSGDSLLGNYIAGIYYPDKTKVGWWKNGYPEYFAKVLNAVNWASVKVTIDNQSIDLNKCEILDFQRILDLKRGVLRRKCTLRLDEDKELTIRAKRCISQSNKELALLEYSIDFHHDFKEMDFDAVLDFDVVNEDSNYEEVFWDPLFSHGDEEMAVIASQTLKTGFIVRASAHNVLLFNEEQKHPDSIAVRERSVAHSYRVQDITAGSTLTLRKKVRIQSPLFYTQTELLDEELKLPKLLQDQSVDELFEAHDKSWERIWDQHDVILEGDDELQQGIRFCIFQLLQTYNCEDGRLNIGPKGFTGEKYGGSTYWDTEAYCLPFYLHTKEHEKVKKLIFYRYRHLEAAIANAKKLGFSNGAALYPMVTMNGEECHNEWEITFEEIHRNAAISYAIYNYINYTGDERYLAQGGTEVLVAIARFWAQRVNWSKDKNLYVMLGVTGPNEYENNVNNNWYTNRMATWCLDYASEAVAKMKSDYSSEWKELKSKINWADSELDLWKNISDKMHYPQIEDQIIFLQQDGFLDKELIPADQIPDENIPLYQNLSWDRILRSCYIKQADVLQGLYALRHQYNEDTIRANYEFYEPLTVHESSLSPCIHSMLAARLRDMDQAVHHFKRSCRLDIDDYNNNSREGCHITSMAGVWIALIEGFAGYDLQDGELIIDPVLPEQWTRLAFSVTHRLVNLHINITSDQVEITNQSTSAKRIYVGRQHIELQAEHTTTIAHQAKILQNV